VNDAIDHPGYVEESEQAEREAGNTCSSVRAIDLPDLRDACNRSDYGDDKKKSVEPVHPGILVREFLQVLMHSFPMMQMMQSLHRCQPDAGAFIYLS